ncbi:Na(+)/H(+) exchanger beta-like [Babylonia areolata]|uniref:Na(+)/H(+) exchanger beta-like n=1 Tax=Babylonia areolata TaxID=304850 RepID=UPI003FD5FCB9
MLHILLVCALTVQFVAAVSPNGSYVIADPASVTNGSSLAIANTTTTQGPNTTEPGKEGEGHGKHRPHTIHVLALEFEAVKEPLIFTVVVLLAGLSKIGFHHADFLSSKIPESCLLIILGTVFGAVLHFCQMSEDLPQLFNPHYFFLFLLPPIILESAFSLYDRTFSENLGTILLFAVVGTILSCFLIGLSLYGLMKVGAMGSVQNMTLVQILVFSSLIVAVDPVAVLAVFSEVGVNDVLYFIVFGESLLNDGVTVVLYKVMQTFNLMESLAADQVVLGIVKFLVVCVGGLVIGVLSGMVSALLTRLTVHVGVAQPLVIYTMAYLGFLLSELFEVSGIISIIGCGLVQRHYAFSNISHKSRTTVKYFTKMLASASEIVIFLFLGLELVSEEHQWETGFVLWTVLLCTVFRFLITFGMACLINRFDTMRVRLIGFDEMFMIAFGGLRGAVAFSLAALLHEEELPMKRMFVTTTLTVVMFTVFFQGITIKPLVNFMSIRLAPEKNQSMYCELNSHVTDHLMAGIEDVVGKKGRNHLRERIEQIDADYFKKWLMNKPDPVDTSLHEFYTKIVIKEHYNNLKLCGATNVAVPTTIPHVDTSLYLHPMTEDKDVDKDTTSEAEPKEEEEQGPALRHRSRMSRASKQPISSDVQGLRSLLKSRRNTRMNLHANFDRNLVADPNDSLRQEIVQKSARNRSLQRLMSTTAHHPLQRCASWGDKSADICKERNAQAAATSGAMAAARRAVSVDLGSQAVSYRPQTSAPMSPRTPLLDSVFEENEEADSSARKAPPGEKAAASPSPDLDTASPDLDTAEESTPMMCDVEMSPVITVHSGSEPPEPEVKQKTRVPSSRKRLCRQDDIKPDDSKPHPI